MCVWVCVWIPSPIFLYKALLKQSWSLKLSLTVLHGWSLSRKFFYNIFLQIVPFALSLLLNWILTAFHSWQCYRCVEVVTSLLNLLLYKLNYTLLSYLNRMPLFLPYNHHFLQCASLTLVPRHNILKLSEQRTDSLKLTSDLKHVMAAFMRGYMHVHMWW